MSALHTSLTSYWTADVDCKPWLYMLNGIVEVFNTPIKVVMSHSVRNLPL